MFAHSRNLAITGGQFTHNNYRLSAFDKLQNASAPNALYDSSARYDPPKCHPNTRVAVLEHLIGWIFGRNDPEALILWLYGPAGAGKSAILQTIAEWCAKNNKLLASFFFGRSDPTRNHIKPFIPTIACQIAITIPEIKPYVEGAIELDPFLLDKSLATQFQNLIVTPLQALITSGNLKPGSPQLVIIDGLDECDDPKMQSMIIKVIADGFHSQNIPLTFLIASRPEQNIMHTFSSTMLLGLWQSVVLDDMYKPNSDIHLFLMDSFHEIKTMHPHCHLIPKTWPSESDVDTLIRKSSGQFIYASQVVKYISDPNDRPSHQLDVIMGLRPARHNLPFAELDALYTHILEGCSHNLDIVLEILGLYIIPIMVHPDDIETFLDMEPGDVAIRLAPLTSIVQVGTYSISLLHTSFGEFITDPSRAPPNCYINQLAVKERALFRLISYLHLHTTPVPSRNEYFCDPSFSYCFSHILPDLPLTKNVKGMLLNVSLSDFWMFAGKQNWVGEASKCNVIYFFLHALHQESQKVTERSAEEFEALEKIYNFHRSSFKQNLELELLKYLKNAELMMMVIVMSLEVQEPSDFVPALKWPSETISMDKQLLGLRTNYYARSLILNHYRELVPVFNPSDYVPAALQILAFFCAKHRHSTRYYKPSQMSKSTPAICIQSAIPQPTQNHGRRPYILTSYATYQKQHRSVPYSRFRRQEKCCHGVHLIRTTEVEYQWPLEILPFILKKCSKSEELITFIRRHGRKIIYFPQKKYRSLVIHSTQNAIRAMHEYLDRVSQDVEIVDTEHPTL